MIATGSVSARSVALSFSWKPCCCAASTLAVVSVSTQYTPALRSPSCTGENDSVTYRRRPMPFPCFLLPSLNCTFSSRKLLPASAPAATGMTAAQSSVHTSASGRP